MPPRSILEIDLAAIDHNLRVMRRIVGPRCELGAIVKADAYGLGATRLLETMQNAGVGRFIVFAPDEANALLEVGTSGTIVVLMPVCTLEEGAAFERAVGHGQVELVIHGFRQMESLALQARRRGWVLPVHLEIDTGMSRGGCGPDEAATLLRGLIESPVFDVRGVMMHFASADRDPQKTARQAARFDQVLGGCLHLLPPDCLIHLANSYAALRSPAWHRTMVRLGSAWVGIGPEMMQSWDDATMPAPLRPAVRWRSRITHLRTIEEGATVGYAGRWTARRPTRIGIIPVGYADGYHHALGATDAKRHGAAVLVHGCESGTQTHAPVVGAVNMDQIAVDLTDTGDVEEGSQVELISPDRDAPNHVTTLASIVGTIPHVLLSQLHPRVARVYMNPPAPLVEVKPILATRQPQLS